MYVFFRYEISLQKQKNFYFHLGCIFLGLTIRGGGYKVDDNNDVVDDASATEEDIFEL